MKLCSFPDCTKPLKCNGLCAGHDSQRREKRELTPLRIRRGKGQSPIITWKEVPCPRKDLEGPCHIYQGKIMKA